MSSPNPCGVSPDLGRLLALRRVLRGGVVQFGRDAFVSCGRRVPGYIGYYLVVLLADGHVRFGHPQEGTGYLPLLATSEGELLHDHLDDAYRRRLRASRRAVGSHDGQRSADHAVVDLCGQLVAGDRPVHDGGACPAKAAVGTLALRRPAWDRPAQARVPSPRGVPMKITSSAVSLNVDDVAASSAFLVKHFGFREDTAADGFASLTRDDAGINVVFLRRGLPTLPADQRDDHAGGLILAFVVEDLDGELARLKDEGVRITMPLTDEEWGERAFQVRDPNGVVVQLVDWHAPTNS